MRITHVALQVRDLNASAAFYARYCGLVIVHQRSDDTGRVAWLGYGEDPPSFVIVLLEHDYETNRQPPYQHIGVAVSRREEVDEVAARAKADGLRVAWPPKDGGPVVGYYCGFADPDGNIVEFSFGQRIGRQ